MTGANDEGKDGKAPRVSRAMLQDAARLVEFAYGIREALPDESRRHLMTALGHAPDVLTALSACEVHMTTVSDITAVVGWATYERNRAARFPSSGP